MQSTDYGLARFLQLARGWNFATMGSSGIVVMPVSLRLPFDAPVANRLSLSA
jgi:hypothetical protein